VNVSEAYVEAMNTVAALASKIPLPPGITSVETNKWRLAVNNGLGNATWETGNCGAEISPFGIAAVHKTVVVMAMLDPAGGTIGGGMTEDEFIAEMKAAQKEHA
jgi:hypothetical protein